MKFKKYFAICLLIILLLSSCSIDSNDEKSYCIHKFPNGIEIFSDELEEKFKGEILRGDFVYIRQSQGLYDDSNSNPNLFSYSKNKSEYLGHRALISESTEISKLKKGDFFSGLIVENAFTEFQSTEMNGGGYYLSGISLEFDGETELCGTLRYYPEVDYNGETGKLEFIPDSSYKDMPMLYREYAGDTISFFKKGYGVELADDFAVYSDAPLFNLGYLSDYNNELSDIITEDEYMSVKVKLTLTDIYLSWTETSGYALTSAKISNYNSM